MSRASLFPALAALALAAPSSAQRLRDRSKPPNDPVQCPYCAGEPELMAAAGVVSHGGFEFSKTDTAGVDAMIATEIFWIETAHFELGVGLPEYRIPLDERAGIRAELERLALALPEIDPRERVLDPWLRAHLYAQRLEDFWDQMLELLAVRATEFPDGRSVWKRDKKYMGEGPYLGQKGKYEVLLLSTEGASETFLRDQFGLRTKLSQRFNVIERDSLILVAHTQQTSLRIDAALHNHVVFNVVHQLLDGYKHYTYDLPVWIQEGLAHWYERGLNPEYNDFDSAEGAPPATTRKTDWEEATRKLVASGDAPSLASLLALNGYADLELEHHFATWSMIDFLQRERPGFLGRLLDRIKGLTNASGIGDGSGLEDAHREAFREGLGMTYAQFDEAWRAWVLEAYGG